jgi:hypothetical protein
MTSTIELPPTPRPVRPAARAATLRLHLLGRSAVALFTALPVGLTLFVLWIVLAALSPITLVAPVLLPVTAAVRGYAGWCRREASRLLGVPVTAAYRPARPGLFGRLRSILTDPASWRDALWLPVHGVLAFTGAVLSVTLFLGTLFYASYPFLFWVTPQDVFGHPFGDWHHLRSVADATVMMPLALVCFGLWYGLQLPLLRAELTVTRALLGRR